jgi:hypothetical protein
MRSTPRLRTIVQAFQPMVERSLPLPHTSMYIRPLAVSPLTDPERVPTPWGFSMPLTLTACALLAAVKEVAA